MTYRAPIAQMLATLQEAAGLTQALDAGLYPDLSADLIEQVLEEAGKFASERIAPLNRPSDQIGLKFDNGKVTTPPGWQQLYKDWCEAGWNGVSATPDFGGQGLPAIVNAACNEMWNAACAAFGLGPVLTQGAIDAITHHASDELKAIYLEKLITGEWTGTMNLTEPQAGSDVGALRSRAVPVGDGSYTITGQKIFITMGEHDLADNIIHLVLARLPDAPAGTKGISLFLVPKIMVKADGSLGEPNDVRCHSIEHKLGIHASPTCTMVYGDNGGAIGWLVGQENKGLNAMFTMMNAARLAVGLQGVAVAERATQQAYAYAADRRQGRAPSDTGAGMSPIIMHADVRRMLLAMRTQTDAARAICYRVAAALDQAHYGADEVTRKAGNALAALLTPVAKGYATDIGIDVASLGVQVHGGMGFIEETGAAQHLRDARIYAIYEGTNGIQAIDLVTRKLPLDGGAVVGAEIARLKATVAEVKAVNDPAFGAMGRRLEECVTALDQATAFLLAEMGKNLDNALAGATPYARLFGLATGGVALAKLALAARSAKASGATDPALDERITNARFYAENLAIGGPALALTVTESGPSVAALSA